MAQLSRPFQLAFLLVAALAVAWFAVLRTHSTASSGGSSGSSTSGSPAARSTAAQAGTTERNQGTPTKVYHGPVPGLHGLSRDIRRAHEAVGASQAQARAAEAESHSSRRSSYVTAPAQTSRTSAPGHPAAASHAASHTHAATGSHAIPAAPTKSSHSGSRPRPGSAEPHHLSRAVVVGNQLKAGKVVLLLFWSERSAEDQAVRSQVQSVSRSLGRRVAADYAKPSEVGAFGSITREVTVLQTPTLLVIDRKGLVTTIAGLTDAFSIEQAVREAGG